MQTPPPTLPLVAAARALRRHLARLERTLDAVRGDLDAAEQAGGLRRSGEALLAYLARVPRRADRVSLPDPHDPARSLDIELDASLTPQVNAARYFRRAAKAERGLVEVPVRLRVVESELTRVRSLLERVEAAAAKDAPAPLPGRARHADATSGHAPTPGRARHTDVAPAPEPDADALLREVYAALPPLLRRGLKPPGPPAAAGSTGAPARQQRPLPARLRPRRLRTTEGWDVLVGRNNEGNDHLTHHLARPEDYWFHVHGAPGSHVVLRRGKGKNEPSKRTLEEVAAWAAYFSHARTAGKVPVIWTRKKYVRRPRNAPPGLAICEREKMLMVRPAAPQRSALADEAEPEP